MENKEEQEKFNVGDKVVFDSACDEQVAYGRCNDPRKILEKGKIYKIEEIEVHNWYTKIKLAGINGKFNSVHFKIV